MAVNASVAKARIDALAQLTDTLIVRSFTTSRSPVGGEVRTPTSVRTYKGLMQYDDEEGYERELTSKITSVGKFVATFPWNAIVLPKDTITAGGVDFRVERTNEPESNRITLKVDCSKVV